METVIKTNGITRKWLVNVLAIVIFIVIIIEIAFAAFIGKYYRDSVTSAAEDYAKGFEILSTVNQSEFAENARETVEEFKYKDKIEIQIIDAYGRVIITTSGFSPSLHEMPDYISALSAQNGSAVWSGTAENGENIIAGTSLLPDFGKGSNGAVRWIVSAEPMNRSMLISVLIAIAVGLVVIAISAVSGVYFIKSIVRPVQEVSNVARKIAMGDLAARLEVKENNEIGELCDSINYMASELANAESVKNDFISSVSHELRTPLTAIKGWGETVKLSVGTDDEIVAKGTEIILNEADRLSSLVEELLDFSRMQMGRLKLDVRPENIIAVLHEAVYMYMELAHQQNIDLVYEDDKTAVEVQADKNRIKQVFINVIDNAIKYTEDGGKVEISTTLEEGCIRINISDSGVGISPKDIDHVKEKFYKANHSVRGSGIGLAVADEIIKQHNGLLLLESTEGVGTTVTIVLPIIEQDTNETPEE